MKRKKPQKKTEIKKSRKPSFGFSLAVLILVFGSFFALISIIRMSTTVHVLGAHTELLAKDSKLNIEEKTSESEIEHVDQPRLTPSPATSNEHTASTGAYSKYDVLVDCVGLDGNHITVHYSECFKLHKGASKDTFSFIPLTKSEPKTEEKVTKTASASVSLEKREKYEAYFRSKTEETKKNSEEKKSIENPTIQTTKHSTSELTHNHVKAESQFTFSHNDQTQTVTVTTATGEKQINILPDKVVENVLHAKLLSNVETELSSDSGELFKKTQLTELHNQPVFAVNGVSEKKVFGFIPVAFSKTVFVSATDGTVVKTDEAWFNTVLEKLSIE